MINTRVSNTRAERFEGLSPSPATKFLNYTGRYSSRQREFTVNEPRLCATVVQIHPYPLFMNRPAKDYSNYEEVFAEYGHLIGSLIEFTNQLSKQKAIGIITGITIAHRSYCCFEIDFYSPEGYNVAGHKITPSVSELVNNKKAFRIIS